MKIVVLGSGSKGNAIYIETEHTKVLFDVGISLKQIKERLLKHNIVFKPDLDLAGFSLVTEFTQIGFGIGYATEEYVAETIAGLEQPDVDLSNYYTKEETYTKDQVDAAIENIEHPDIPTKVSDLDNDANYKAVNIKEEVFSSNFDIFNVSDSIKVNVGGEMQDWLLRLREKLSSTTILVTHDIEEALYLADRIIILSGKPATISKEIHLKGIRKSRDWLFNQGELKKELYELLAA